MADSRLAEPIAVTVDAVRAFAELGVRYAIGGSLASSLHGRPRATDDVDILAAVGRQHARELVKRWGAAYYADENMILEAVRDRSSFNIVHYESVVKIDVFVASNDEFANNELDRARSYVVSEDPPAELVLVSADDIVLQKLRWYRLGGEISERQWRDIVGVLEVRGASIDLEHLHHWAPVLKVQDLLDRVLRETEGSR